MYYANGHAYPSEEVAEASKNPSSIPVAYREEFYFLGDCFTTEVSAYEAWSIKNADQAVQYDGQWLKAGIFYQTQEEAVQADPNIIFYDGMFHVNRKKCPTLEIAKAAENASLHPIAYDGSYYYLGKESSNELIAYLLWSMENSDQVIHCSGKAVKNGVAYPTEEELLNPDLKREPTDSYYHGLNYSSHLQAMAAFSGNNEGIFEVNGYFVSKGLIKHNKACFLPQPENQIPFFEQGEGYYWNNKCYPEQHSAWIAFSIKNPVDHPEVLYTRRGGHNIPVYVVKGFNYTNGTVWSVSSDYNSDESIIASLLFRMYIENPIQMNVVLTSFGKDVLENKFWGAKSVIQDALRHHFGQGRLPGNIAKIFRRH